MSCPIFPKIESLIKSINQAAEIKKLEEDPLRYDVWGTTSDLVRNMIKDLTPEGLPKDNNSVAVKDKLKGILSRVSKNDHKPNKFVEGIIGHKENIGLSIALHELMESVKGESDKARNLDIPIDKITIDGILPSIPAARLAASIGRKIAFQQGFRFHNTEENSTTPAEIEELYHKVGMTALEILKKEKYVVLSKGNTIKDYIDEKDVGKERPSTNEVVSGVLSVSLNTKTLGVKVNSEEAAYFLERQAADITNTELGAIAGILTAVRQITQPSKYSLPHVKERYEDKDFKEKDDRSVKPDKKTDKARKQLYKKPLKVHESVHALLKLLNAEVTDKQLPATKIINDLFGSKPHLLQSLFGMKNSNLFSVDKRESVTGQNLSKTTALDDLAEYYNLLMEEGSPASLHLPMKIGRNARLYYLNSVLNPHASKQSRYMLTGGKQTIEVGSEDYKYLIYQIADTLDGSLTYDDVVNGSNENLESALKVYQKYHNAKDLVGKLANLSHLPRLFPGKDYVSLLTTLQAVQDIRNADKTVTTEFNVSADATASGGTLTFFQALGTNKNIKQFLEDVGLLVKEDGAIDVKVSDLYQIMTDAIQDFVTEDKDSNTISPDLGVDESSIEEMLKDTLKLLFNEGQDARELSKDPTMTFVYGQRKKGAIQTIATSLADRIIDNLDDPKTRAYLAKLFKDSSFLDENPKQLKQVEGLYKNIKMTLIEGSNGNLPGQLYELLNTSLENKYLKEHQKRSEDIFTLAKRVAKGGIIKVLPAGAVLDGENAKTGLSEYGMSVAKIFEVMNKTSDGTEVLTRRELLQKTVMDVSTIHGIDAALLYHSLEDIKFKDGVVVVHDDVRGSVSTVRAAEKAYVSNAKKVMEMYDIHDQMLQSLTVYDPDIISNPEYKRLRADVDTSMKVKEGLSSSFNEKTTALIGDGDTFKGFSEGRSKPKSIAKQPPRNKAKETLQELAKNSPLIQKFLNVFQTQIKEGTEFSYSPKDDTITLDKGAVKGKSLMEAVEHEIIHAATVSEIRKVMEGDGSKASTRDVRYFQKTLKSLLSFSHKISEDLQERLDYINAQPTEEQQIAEFVAIMQSEKDIAREIYSLFEDKTLQSRITAFLHRVRMFIAELTDSDLAEAVDARKLYGALSRTLDRGISSRIEQQEETQKVLKSIKDVYGYGKNNTLVDINYLNKAVSRLLMDKAEEKGKSILGGLHGKLKDYPLYSDVVDKLQRVYDNSEDFQQLVHTVTGEGVDKKKKADVLAKFAQVSGQRNDVIQKSLSEFEELTKSLSTEERKTLDSSILGIPLHDYFVLSKELNTVEKINTEVTKLEKEFGANSKVVKDVNALVKLNLQDKASNGSYNLQNYNTNEKYHTNVKKLLSLKSIQEVGAENFVKLLDNTDLIAKVEDHTVANHLSLMGFNGSANLRAAGVPHSFSEGIQQRAITLEELSMYEYGENTGWEVVTKPTKGTLGLVYREVVDSTSIPGAFTDVKMSSADLNVEESKRAFSNVMATPNGYRMILTQEQRNSMGALGAIQSLVRGTAHAMSIQESQIIREEMLKKETTFKVSSDNLQDLKDTVEDSSRENPWFLKKNGINYSDLPDSIKARYKPVGNRVSNVKGFNTEVDFVRKDISHWLLGGSSSSPFANPKWKWALRITKDLVSMAKIGMVVLNPGKIARDNISNVAYLGVVGVSPSFAANSYKNIIEEFGDYTENKNALLNLKVQLVAKPGSTSLQKKARSLQKKLDKNPISSIEAKGFLNSLGSALVTKENETLGGAQKDVDTALKFLLKEQDGKSSYLAHFLMQLQKVGPHGENFLSYLGGVVGKYKGGKELDNELTKISERLAKIRTDKDVKAYAAQFINAPQSEAVRFGANITDLSDVLAKETYYRHLVENEGMSDSDARVKVLDSFPNYIENMPLAIQQASDVGILMFPSFWMRIQKVIYRMAKDRPVSLATEEAIDTYFNTNVDTIVDANIVNKATSWGGIAHSPLEVIGGGSILPLHVL